ncbi:MAG: hypothetical protein RMJ59_06085 [Candidatus Nitrosocaldus sp.]|nr:hypothetical protein [Candidatus Nitrosocaldus sp.]MDW8275931.1 hypothetical protein [Candidatus Nitrosocaldus sp.]
MKNRDGYMNRKGFTIAVIAIATIIPTVIGVTLIAASDRSTVTTGSMSHAYSPLPTAKSEEYVPPQEADGIRIDLSVRGGEVIDDPTYGRMVAVKTGDVVYIVVSLTNVSDRVKAYDGSFNYVYNVFDVNGISRLNIRTNVLLAPDKPIVINPKESFTFEIPWGTEIDPLADAPQEVIEEILTKGLPYPTGESASPGVYTIRVTTATAFDYDVVQKIKVDLPLSSEEISQFQGRKRIADEIMVRVI